MADTVFVTGPNFQQTTNMGDTQASMLRQSVQAGITASTTQTLAAGTQMTGMFVTISTCTNDNDAVKLRQASALTIGQSQWVWNNGAKIASVFPGEATTKIDGGGAGAAVALTNAKNAVFVQVDAGNWVSAQGGVKSA